MHQVSGKREMACCISRTLYQCNPFVLLNSVEADLPEGDMNEKIIIRLFMVTELIDGRDHEYQYLLYSVFSNFELVKAQDHLGNQRKYTFDFQHMQKNCLSFTYKGS